MSDNDLSAELADAVADGITIDWTTRGAGTDTVDLLYSFRVISSIGEASRAAVKNDQDRGARALNLLAVTVAAIAGSKLALAFLSGVAGWSRVSPLDLHWGISLNVLLCGAAGVMLIAGGTRDLRAQSLGVLLLIIASAFVDPLLPVLQQGGSVSVMSWARQICPDAFLAFALWRFAWLFPTLPAEPQARTIGRTFLAASAALGLVLFILNAAKGLTGTTAIQGTLRLLDRNDATHFYWPLLFVVAAPAIVFLLWKSRLQTAADKRRVTWFLASLVLGLSPMLVAVILTPLIPQLRSPEWQTLIGAALYVMLASIVPSTAYAVTVSHVLDVRLVIRRTIQYGLARSSVWCAIVGPLLFVAFDIYEHRQITVGAYFSGERPVAPLLLSCLSLVVLTFRHHLLEWLDRWFHRGAADHTEALARLERGFRTTRTVRDVARVLTREVGRAVDAASVAVLIVDEKGGQLVALDHEVPPLPRGSALIDLLRSVRTETQLSYRADGALATLLPPSDRAWLSETGFGLFSPLMGSTGTLIGIVGIAEARNGLPYTERDNMLITAMSGQAALKLENSRLRERPGHRGSVRDQLSVDWDNEPATRCPECATLWPPTTTQCSCGVATIEAALPLVIKGKFRVDRFIGAGGAGVVYHAVDMTLDRQVAIKTLLVARIEHVSRLHREARAMANVMHPNLALIYGAEHWKSTPLLIFEYLDGGTLLESLRSGPLKLEETIELGTLLADALDRVHSSGVLHRDVKPSNIGYTASGVPKLLDFGLAAILDRSRSSRTPPAVMPTDLGLLEELTWGVHPAASLTLTQQLIGTPLYLSPEALAGHAPEASFDLWSLSLVLYEAFAGRHPLAGEAVMDVVKQIQQGTIPDIRHFRPDCPDAFAAFLNDALAPVAARRPATAADLRSRLRWLQKTLLARAV
jgi:tRNA A-37 threonylcarbamoyl transferase component Bud32